MARIAITGDYYGSGSTVDNYGSAATGSNYIPALYSKKVLKNK